MRGIPRHRVAPALLLAATAAEAAERLLAPRTRLTPPAPVDLRAYFSAEQIDRGARYARPQLALALTRTAVDLGAIALLVRRPSPALSRTWGRPVLGGAVVGATLSLGLGLPTLPLRALARRRAMAAGLDTQSWRAWSNDLVKASAIQTALAAGGAAAVVAATRR
ncbi:MAG: hypothetical protein M3065_00825, partial [Actinomycetota bacterium]|nr:hypothetical protein [Actinomycetota bacterium]